MKISIPGSSDIKIMYAVFDFNGTIALDGIIQSDTRAKIMELANLVPIYVLTADTNGTASNECDGLPLTIRCFSGEASSQKAKIVSELGAQYCVCFGNGNNDIEMFKVAGLSIAVVGEEGVCSKLFLYSDIVVNSINDGISLLLNTNRVVADLRH